jgi:RNA polymerase sigma-70 factor (ECF subfamily)
VGDLPLDVGDVYSTHAKSVWKFLRYLGVWGSDCEDCFQQVFVAVVRRRDDYKPTAPVQAWLFGICTNVVKHHRRTVGRRQKRDMDTVEQLSSTAPPQDEQAASQELLHRVLDAMVPEQRALLWMFEVEEQDCPAIARELGIPVGTVYSRLSTARKAFKHEWQRMNPRGQGDRR